MGKRIPTASLMVKVSHVILSPSAPLRVNRAKDLEGKGISSEDQPPDSSPASGGFRMTFT